MKGPPYSISLGYCLSVPFKTDTDERQCRPSEHGFWCFHIARHFRWDVSIGIHTWTHTYERLRRWRLLPWHLCRPCEQGWLLRVGRWRNRTGTRLCWSRRSSTRRWSLWPLLLPILAHVNKLSFMIPLIFLVFFVFSGPRPDPPLPPPLPRS